MWVRQLIGESYRGACASSDLGRIRSYFDAMQNLFKLISFSNLGYVVVLITFSDIHCRGILRAGTIFNAAILNSITAAD